MECGVCCETSKKVVTCHYCDYVTCIPCASRYILEGTVNAVCMNCKKPWNREILIQKFGKTFITKKYKTKRENDLYETEKALMPETQPYATAKKELDSINKEIAQLQKRLKELKRRKMIINTTGGVTVAEVTAKSVKLSIKCPGENCRGYVNSDTMTCEVCDSHVCKECHEVKGDSHTCDPNTVETVKMMKKDTKSCPKCKVSIHKISGCDQMYCVQCHTAFSWRTGEIVFGHIHNPHYYEYMRRTGGGAAPREVGDIPCGGIPNIYTFTKKHGKNAELMAFHRMLTHVEHEELRNYRTNRIENNRDLRIKFLNNEITEKQFKTTLQRREKEREKRDEISQVLNTLLVAGSEIIRKDKIDMNEISELIDFTNDAMKRVSKLFTCVVPICNDSMIITKKKF